MSIFSSFQIKPRIGFEPDGKKCLYVGWAKLLLPNIVWAGDGSAEPGLSPLYSVTPYSGDNDFIGETGNYGGQPVFNLSGVPMVHQGGVDVTGKMYGTF